MNSSYWSQMRYMRRKNGDKDSGKESLNHRKKGRDRERERGKVVTIKIISLFM